MALAQLSHVYPIGTRVNERGRLEVGGCDTVELAREFGTPAYVVAEDDLRARARTYRAALAARHDDFDVLFASKAFPATAVYRLLAEEGLGCDVASGGELHLALAGGMDPARIHLHGNAKSDSELQPGPPGRGGSRGHRRAGRDRSRGRRGAAGPAPGRAGARDPRDQAQHARLHLHRPARLQVRALDRGRARRDRARAGQPPAGAGRACTCTWARRSSSWSRSGARWRRSAALGDFGTYNLGGGLGVAYTAGDEPPSIEAYVEAKVSAVHEFAGRRQAHPAGARPLAGGQRRRDAVLGGVGQADGLHLRRGGRRHVRQPAPDALRRGVRGGDRRPARRARASCAAWRASTASPAT